MQSRKIRLIPAPLCLLILPFIGFAASGPAAGPNDSPNPAVAQSDAADNASSISLVQVIEAATALAQQRWPGCQLISTTLHHAFDGDINEKTYNIAGVLLAGWSPVSPSRHNQTVSPQVGRGSGSSLPMSSITKQDTERTINNL